MGPRDLKRAKNKPHGPLLQASEYATRRRAAEAEKIDCGDYSWRQRARSGSNDVYARVHRDQPGIDVGSSAATAPAACTYHTPRPALADREQARCAPAAY